MVDQVRTDIDAALECNAHHTTVRRSPLLLKPPGGSCFPMERAAGCELVGVISLKEKPGRACLLKLEVSLSSQALEELLVFQLSRLFHPF